MASGKVRNKQWGMTTEKKWIASWLRINMSSRTQRSHLGAMSDPVPPGCSKTVYLTQITENPLWHILHILCMKISLWKKNQKWEFFAKLFVLLKGPPPVYCHPLYVSYFPSFEIVKKKDFLGEELCLSSQFQPWKQRPEEMMSIPSVQSFKALEQREITF